MRGDTLLEAVQTLLELDGRDRARQAAVRLPDDLPVADLLRAADGAQQLARAFAALRGTVPTEDDGDDATRGHDPHDVRSLYS